MLSLVFLVATADPTLQAIVALGRGEPPPVAATVEEAADATEATDPTTPTTGPTVMAAPAPVLLRSESTEPGPWAGVAMLVALGGGAFALWWRKRGMTSTNLLEIKQSVAIGRGRNLLVAEISGRRVLLSSSEAGIALLLELGASPEPVSIAKAPPQLASFDDAVEDLMPSMAMTTANVDIEGQEIKRRLAQARGVV